MTSWQPTIGIMTDLARFMLRLNVPCPRCGNDSGYPCRTPAGRYMPVVHAGRDHLAVITARSALHEIFISRNAARMRARRAGTLQTCLQQEGNMTASPISISRIISRTSRTSGTSETISGQPDIT